MTSFFGPRYLPEVFGRATHKLGDWKEPGEEKKEKMARRNFYKEENGERERKATEGVKEAGGRRNSETDREASSDDCDTEDQVSCSCVYMFVL